MKIYKIAFLLDKSNNWLEKDTKDFIKSYKKNILLKFFMNIKKLKNLILLFVLGIQQY